MPQPRGSDHIQGLGILDIDPQPAEEVLGPPFDKVVAGIAVRVTEGFVGAVDQKLIILKTGKKFRTHHLYYHTVTRAGQGGPWWVGWWVAGFDPVAFTL